MKRTFNPYYFIVFISLLLIEISIALLLKKGFIRHTFGDFLATILLYSLVKSFLKLNPLTVSIIVLVIAYGLEFFQLYHILNYFNLENNKVAALIFGTTFSYQDLIAYTLGVVFVGVLDYYLIKRHII